MAFPFELSVDLSTLAILAMVAFIAGFIDAIAGGGGLLTIPALLTAGLPPHLALGVLDARLEHLCFFLPTRRWCCLCFFPVVTAQEGERWLLACFIPRGGGVRLVRQARGDGARETREARTWCSSW